MLLVFKRLSIRESGGTNWFSPQFPTLRGRVNNLLEKITMDIKKRRRLPNLGRSDLHGNRGVTRVHY